MKKILICLTACLGLFLATSCEDKEWTDSKVTYYATLTLEGDDFIVLDKGTAYVEPGYSAEMKGADVTSAVQVTTDLDVNTSGVYSVNYLIVNEDGFSVSESRTVVVLDPNDAVEGFYATDPASFRDNRKGTLTTYGKSFEILVIGQPDGTYFVDDILGGYYGQRAGYGADYYLEGNISIADDGTVTLNSSFVNGWGDSADDMTGGKWDASTKTLSWCAIYANMEFNVSMTKE